MAVEVLIQLITEGDPGDHQRVRGDVIEVRPYPHRGWGLSELLPRYGIIRISDSSYEEMTPLCKRHHIERDVDGVTVLWHCRSQMRLTWASLSSTWKDTLRTGSVLKLNKSELLGKAADVISARRAG
jgi:hypothetical protein